MTHKHKSRLTPTKKVIKEENYNTVWYKNTDTLIKGKWIPTMPPSIQDYKKPVLKFLNEDD